MLSDAWVCAIQFVFLRDRLHLALSFGVQAHHLLAFVPTKHLAYLFQTVLQNSPTVLETIPYYRREQQQIPFVLMRLSSISWQATSSFVFPVFVLSLLCNLLVLTRRKNDLAVPSRLPNCNINLSYNCWLYRVTIEHAVFHHIDTVSYYMQTWLMISLKGVQFKSWFSNKWCNLNHDFLIRGAIGIMIS